MEDEHWSGADELLSKLWMRGPACVERREHLWERC